MPVKKRGSDTKPSLLQMNLYRLRRIAMDLEDKATLNESDRSFLINAFLDINRGIDANEALGVKAKRGQRKKVDPIAQVAMICIAKLIEPVEEGGFGMSIADAIAEAARTGKNEASFGMTEDSLRYYWTHGIYGHSTQMARPIETLPDRAKSKARNTK